MIEGSVKQNKQGSLKDSYIPHRTMTMEQSQNSRLKLVAFNCDLDLESALLSYGLCISSHLFDPNLINIFQRVQEK